MSDNNHETQTKMSPEIAMKIKRLPVQMKTKPKAENVAAEILDSDNLCNVLNFTKFLSDNKLTLKWASYDSWTVKYKSKVLCYVKMDILKSVWDIRLWSVFFDEYDKYITDDELKKFVLTIINPPLCDENRLNCPKRKNEMILGKTFDVICRCWSFKVDNPDGKILEDLKKLVLISKNIIIDLTMSVKS